MEDMPLGVQESPPPTWRTWLGNPGYQPPAPEGDSPPTWRTWPWGSRSQDPYLGVQESPPTWRRQPGGPGVTPNPHLEDMAWGIQGISPPTRRRWPRIPT